MAPPYIKGDSIFSIRMQFFRQRIGDPNGLQSGKNHRQGRIKKQTLAMAGKDDLDKNNA